MNRYFVIGNEYARVSKFLWIWISLEINFFENTFVFPKKYISLEIIFLTYYYSIL